MPLPPKDPDHWLLRLAPDEWLRAALHELTEADAAFKSRGRRHGVASARRAAGMALNAVLVVRPNEAWGRSYMDHLREMAKDSSVPELVRTCSRELLEAALEGPKLIQLGGSAGDEGLVSAAATICEWARTCVEGAS